VESELSTSLSDNVPLLQKQHCDFLFFSLNKSNKPIQTIRSTLGGYSSSINKNMSTSLDPNLPIINSRKLRLNLSQYFINKYGLLEASLMNQSSIKTNLKHYTNKSQTNAIQEIGTYQTNFHLKTLTSKENTKDIGTGRCKHIHHPVPIIENDVINVDCKQSEGCLFCEQFCVHLDEEDLRKLYSFKFIINESRYLSKSDEHFEKTFGDIIKRIDYITETMTERSLELKKKDIFIKNDIFEKQNLTQFWEYKLGILQEIGVYG